MAPRDKRFRWRWIALTLLGLVTLLLVASTLVLQHVTETHGEDASVLRWLIAGQLLLVLAMVLVVTWGVRVQRREFQQMARTQRELQSSEEAMRKTMVRLDRHNAAIAERAQSREIFGDSPALAYRAHNEADDVVQHTHIPSSTSSSSSPASTASSAFASNFPCALGLAGADALRVKFPPEAKDTKRAISSTR